MLGYQDYLDLSQSPHADDRGQAARIAARAYLEHDGPADEHAALYAAVLSFLDDTSVKVRAALAYELLRSSYAPRPVMFALAQDDPIIATAVVQYSPVLKEADLHILVKSGDEPVLLSIAGRQNLSPKLVATLLAKKNRAVDLKLICENADQLSEASLLELCDRWADDAELRGALLDNADLPAAGRYLLTEQIAADLSAARYVKGAIQPARLKRLMRDLVDDATTHIGDDIADQSAHAYVEALIESGRLTPRLLIQSYLFGRNQFFASCLGQLARMPAHKAVALLVKGSRRGMYALFIKCGFDAPLSNLICRLVTVSRSHDLAHDQAARHFVVSQLITALIDEHEGDLPESLEPIFAYLNEMNVTLARNAARGVMATFCDRAPNEARLSITRLRGEALALPAA
ncbi:uncharacterized protein (DUF2336 family) [Maritalea mobilis]|uniref:Uncharacterized protein (DUF2336 family) n=1 Tax=Maritalea mobilis TaxID=483324 RepID=A0A4R6VT04_9HYPH|nr:DUF2336 domain-containing protein [Maritalea mobilis]TDQ66571.1 uncharacterized protein (DUF2336 family) [Maritalea mobilis]